jgi:hypothetical protein
VSGAAGFIARLPCTFTSSLLCAVGETPIGERVGLIVSYIQGDQIVSVHLMITIQKVTSNV